MRDTENVTATDNVVELDELSLVTGGVTKQPNGGGCTGPFNPFPTPSPTFPNPSPTFPNPLPTFPGSPLVPLVANK